MQVNPHAAGYYTLQVETALHDPKMAEAQPYHNRYVQFSTTLTVDGARHTIGPGMAG
jgi:hypothetical protein